MAAAAGRRLRGETDEVIAARYRLKLDDGQSRNGGRSKTVERMAKKGDALWAQVGGWPWAAFIDENGGREMPHDWWTHPDAERSLTQLLREHQARTETEFAELAERVRLARRAAGETTTAVRVTWGSGSDSRRFVELDWS